MRFEDRVNKIELKLNDVEDDIIEYIRSHIDDIKDVSIRKMSSELFIAPNSIMRLSKKLGYSGFAELKFAVQNETMKSQRPYSQELISMLPNNIVKTLDIIDNEEIAKVASVMRNSSSCIFAGVGDSNYYCELLGKNMRCIDYNVSYFREIHDMFYAVEHGKSTDALIIISARGENKRLVDLAEKGKEKGMKVISITHLHNNPLAKTADYQLYFWGENRTVQGYNVTDRTGLMMLIRLLSETFWSEHN